MYIRIDVWDNAIKGQSYFLQLNIGTANNTFADHLLQVWANSRETPPVSIVLYEYERPHPQIGSFTSRLINGLVANILTPYPGFTGDHDTTAHGRIGVYDGTHVAVEAQIPIEWYSSKRKGAVTANDAGENIKISTIFTDTGTFGSVGAVKDTINNADGITQSYLINTLTGEVVSENLVIPRFTSLPLVILVTSLVVTRKLKHSKTLSG